MVSEKRKRKLLQYVQVVDKIMYDFMYFVCVLFFFESKTFGAQKAPSTLNVKSRAPKSSFILNRKKIRTPDVPSYQLVRSGPFQGSPKPPVGGAPAKTGAPLFTLLLLL